MGSSSGLPVVDHHCHLSVGGEGLGAVVRFRKAGGTHLFLATQNYEIATPTTLEQYRRQFETTELLARRAREEAGVVAYPVLAPYPVDLVRAAETLGLGPALDLHERALDLAAAEVRERRAVALGEVGRPHFPIPAEVREAIDRAFRHALELACDAHCPIVVHSEDLTADGFRALGEEAARAGVTAGHVVKHYARERAAGAGPTGIVPSYLARRELAAEVLNDPGPWFWETDFLDDPQRKGAVLDLATVPRRAAAVLAQGPAAAERLWGPFVESVKSVYGFEPRIGPGGPE